MKSFDRIVVVTKPAELDRRLRSFASVAAVEFFLASRGQSIAGLEREATAYARALDLLLSLLPPLPRAVVSRAELPAFLWREGDLAIAIGPDGLVINAAKYLEGQPILGINPDPGSVAGTLARVAATDAHALERTLGAAVRGELTETHIALAEARFNDGRVAHAANDFLIGRLDQVSARYRITLGGRTERQSSSGVLISTGLGAQAWLKSIVTGAARIAAAQLAAAGSGGAGADPELVAAIARLDLAWSDPTLVYAVREPFLTPHTGADLTFGRLAPGERIVIESEMSEGGAVLSDGIVEDSVGFNAGTAVTIAASQRSVRLLG